MNVRAVPPLLVLLILTCLAYAFASPAEEEKGESVVIGPTTREQIESAVPEWVQAEVEAAPEVEVARSLASVEPGAEVTVFLGTWCGDSRREVPRFWKALAMAGFDVPFEVRYIGVDRGKKEPANEVAANDIRYLPTFIVRRDGREVGRIVETSPHGVEHDLLDLLNGKARGVLATREDLTSPGSAKPPR
ncbi:MAG TPA: thioredoxin family protein [Thermoanaerobaculia bacterium]|jgi:thiol-disulfide isomerase/thioredoxin|nr:thioredoxin family protein [Thermoanaerobaculia bacterium]